MCHDVLQFLFCSSAPLSEALDHPAVQDHTDQGYRRRDLLFRNRAREGLWADVRNGYDAHGVVADAKNYAHEIDAETVFAFAAKYLNPSGVGRFGILVSRHLPSDVRDAVPLAKRTPGLVEAQKEEWEKRQKMVVLLDDDDLVQMLHTRAAGADPTDLVSDRIFTLRSRV